jgi:ubiquinone/menaquinone biosynthesis C-methylase UbiE
MRLNPYSWCIAALLLTTAVGFVSYVYVMDHYEHTYKWFDGALPDPNEVASWDADTRFNNLYKLSRWDGFLSGTQFNRFVRDQVDALGQNKTEEFRFLEVGIGVGAFALEILKMYPLSSGAGIDVLPRAVSIAEVVLPPTRMLVKVGDMRNIEFRASEFDVVYVPGALCYLLSLEDVKVAVSEFYRVLKQHGGLCISMIASDTSDMGSCNTRIPKTFWTHDMETKYGFRVLRLEDMQNWHLPHASGRYSICLRK